MSMEPKHSLNRRSFMQTGALAAVAAGGISCATAGKSKTASILNYNPEMKYRRLGDTDIHLSVISMGGLVMEEPVHHYAIDHGVNLVHISTSYIGGQAIQKLGNVLKTRRSEVYVALKDNFAVGEFAPEKLDEVLSILNTDYVDFFMFNRHKKDEGKDPKIREIFEKYREMGKVRYAGLTSHGEVKETIGAGIQSGMFDLVNPVLNQPSFEAIQPELQAAREAKNRRHGNEDHERYRRYRPGDCLPQKSAGQSRCHNRCKRNRRFRTL